MHLAVGEFQRQAQFGPWWHRPQARARRARLPSDFATVSASTTACFLNQPGIGGGLQQRLEIGGRQRQLALGPVSASACTRPVIWAVTLPSVSAPSSMRKPTGSGRAPG